MRRWIKVGIFTLIWSAAGFVAATEAVPPNAPNVLTIRAMMAVPENRVDLAKAEVTIEHMIDPHVDEGETLKMLGDWADRVRLRIPPGASRR